MLPEHVELFRRQGCLIVRGALAPAVCAEAVDGFLAEVHLDTGALFLRPAPQRYAAHAYTGAGRMRFPIVNLQDISGRRYPQFKAAGLALLTDAALRQAVEALLGGPARLLRTMYSDGGHGAQLLWECAGAGAGIGALIAAEDADGEGPALRQGDLLLWSAKAGEAVPACPQRAFIGCYSARAPCAQHGGLTLGGVEIVLHGGRNALAGRAAAALRTAWPRLYTVLRGREGV